MGKKINQLSTNKNTSHHYLFLAVHEHNTTHHYLFLAKVKEMGMTAICQLTCTSTAIP